VNRVVPVAALEAETMALARRLAEGPTLAYSKAKHLFRQSFDRGLAGQLEAERDAFCASTRTRDLGAGAPAFFDWRPPTFEGR